MTQSALVLGGTSFVGRHLVQALLDDGWDVTLFHRGRTGVDLFPDVPRLTGDRDGDVSALTGTQRWDVVHDVSAYHPDHVDRVADALLGPDGATADRVGHYVLVSTVSVYAPLAEAGATEDAALLELLEPVPDRADMRLYGELKVLCERRAVARFGTPTLARPTIVAGPYDPTDRFTYWVQRLAEPGDHVVPPDLDVPTQWVDARDLAAFLVRAGAERLGGPFTVADEPHAFRELVETCVSVSGSGAQLVPLPAGAVGDGDGQVRPWVDLPLWLDPATNDSPGMLQVSAARARAAGFVTRSPQETVADVLAWLQAEPRELSRGLSRDREAELVQQARR
ncbi:NAD-dependent epimerase/dehydratase family protein [Aquipuribacter sp. SD81]|uniref:NAD-dependent epimerase/dehydratase family protein n=1 Tax=Aquipuribacter sp. SD81 TaxID=3127703 RepID=UPI00301AD404